MKHNFATIILVAFSTYLVLEQFWKKNDNAYSRPILERKNYHREKGRKWFVSSQLYQKWVAICPFLKFLLKSTCNRLAPFRPSIAIIYHVFLFFFTCRWFSYLLSFLSFFELAGAECPTTRLWYTTVTNSQYCWTCTADCSIYLWTYCRPTLIKKAILSPFVPIRSYVGRQKYICQLIQTSCIVDPRKEKKPKQLANWKMSQQSFPFDPSLEPTFFKDRRIHASKLCLRAVHHSPTFEHSNIRTFKHSNIRTFAY